MGNVAFIDSCVLLDIFNDDPGWFDWSSNALFDLSRNHELVINMVVFTEVSINFESVEKLETTLTSLDIVMHEIPAQAAFKVGRIFKEYRKNKGNRKTPMPGFYIGAHASVLSAPLVTRDVSRFRTYFPEVRLICPDSEMKP